MTYCNPGSVGQPRDYDPRASYLVITDDGISFRHARYPVDRTIDAMKDAGFGDHFYRNLLFGCKIGDPIMDEESAHE